MSVSHPAKRRPPTPTMRAVARSARVSVMTVSNVVNARFDMMSEETRERVERSIAELGYRRHASARSLRLAQRFSVGMIVVDPLPSFLADPFITQVVAGLSNALAARGFTLTLAGTPAEGLADAVFVRNDATDAMCVMLSGPRADRRGALRRLAALGQPIVLIQETMRGDWSDVCFVRQDDLGGAHALARRVLDRGARNLMFLVPSLAWPALEARERGIRRAAGAIRGATVEVLASGSEDFAATQAALDRHVETAGLPEAILAANDQMGIAALKWLRMRGVDVPGELLLTGFNAFDFWQYTDPVLTTVRSPAYEIGAVSGQEIIHRLTANTFSRRDILLPVALQPGGTA